MKWEREEVEKLKELCYAGKSNKDIAEAIGRDIKDVYAKRSQMGITIDKCRPCAWDPTKTVYATEQAVDPKKKAASINADFENAVAEMEKQIKYDSLTKAFNDLEDALMLASVRDRVADEASTIYMTYSILVSALKTSMREAIRVTKKD